jgi:antitoxin component YwqK of YwqJK toxin-antitoxin module
MKKCFILFLFLYVINSFSQNQATYYYDKQTQITLNKEVAVLTCKLTYKANNKSGALKIFLGNNLLFTGGFLSFNKEDLSNRINDGLCTFYYQNGTKKSESRYVNGKEIGTRYNYNEDGKINSEIPILNGNSDEENTLQYVYSNDYYTTFKGSILNNKLNGIYTIYHKEGDITTMFLKNSSIDMPAWTIAKPFSKDKKSFAIFEDSFNTKEINNNWFYKSDEKATIGVVNNQLNISFNSNNIQKIKTLHLDDAPISLDKNDFSISVKISGGSNAMGQGIEFGILDNDNLFRVGLVNINGIGKIVYEKIVDGNFVEEKTIDKIWYRVNEDNELNIKKRGNIISITVNGYSALEIENAKLLGDGISLFGVGVGNHNEAYFKDFKSIIEVVNGIPSKVSMTREGGVYKLPVELNGVLKIDFILDSGASELSISPDVALTLLKTGTIKDSDWLPGAYYRFADGSSAKSKRFVLKSIKIGDRLITNISCSISNSINSPMLLGQNVLSKFGKYTIDNKGQVLILENK